MHTGLNLETLIEAVDPWLSKNDQGQPIAGVEPPIVPKGQGPMSPKVTVNCALMAQSYVEQSTTKSTKENKVLAQAQNPVENPMATLKDLQVELNKKEPGQGSTWVSTMAKTKTHEGFQAPLTSHTRREGVSGIPATAVSPSNSALNLTQCRAINCSGVSGEESM